MAMVDVLCHMREKALTEVNPHLMTFATLTGHAAVAMGPFTALIDNGPLDSPGPCLRRERPEATSSSSARKSPSEKPF